MSQRTRSPGQIVAFVTHARRVPAVERDRFGERVRGELAGRAFILETCHRVEGYVFGADDAERLALAVALPDGGQALSAEGAVRHAIGVAVGRDSVVVGEDQVLHQLRVAVDEARGAGNLEPALERLFALALQAGRRARSWHQGPRRSLADVAVAAIERQSGPLRGRCLLIVGAGRMGRLAARAAIGAGASIAVANRSVGGAQALAATNHGEIEPFDPGSRVGRFDGVIVALAGPWNIGPATVDALRESTTVVVDLSVPAAVPETVAKGLGGRFVSADALALADDDARAPRDGSAARLEALVDRTTAEFLAWLNGRDGRAAAEALISRADLEREAELAALWRRLPDLEPDAREAIEGMARHLEGRLLREPLERLGRDPDGRSEQAVRDIFAL
jgi:glutamyl-tRNA reductase